MILKFEIDKNKFYINGIEFGKVNFYKNGNVRKLASSKVIIGNKTHKLTYENTFGKSPARFTRRFKKKMRESSNNKIEVHLNEKIYEWTDYIILDRLYKTIDKYFLFRNEEVIKFLFKTLLLKQKGIKNYEIKSFDEKINTQHKVDMNFAKEHLTWFTEKCIQCKKKLIQNIQEDYLFRNIIMKCPSCDRKYSTHTEWYKTFQGEDYVLYHNIDFVRNKYEVLQKELELKKNKKKKK